MGEVCFRLVKSEPDLHRVLSLRRRVLVEEFGRIAPGDEADPYDPIGDIFCALEDGFVVGTLRVVRETALRESSHDAAPTAFCIERRVNLAPLRGEGRSLCEVSRLVVPDRSRCNGKPIALGLFACIHALAAKWRIDDVLIVANCEMNRPKETEPPSWEERLRTAEVPGFYLRMGFQPMGPIREPHFYDNFAVCSAPMRLRREALPPKYGRFFETLRERIEM
jgi:predicted GNAT family N-acyltransferase